MKIFITRVLPRHPAAVSLQWELEDVSESGTFQFRIQRSGSPGGPWTELALVNDVFTWTDPLNQEEANTLSLGRDIYYRIIVIPPSGVTNQVVSAATNLDGLTEFTISGPIEAIGYKIDSESQREPGPANTHQFQRPPTLAGRKRLLKRAMQRHQYIGLKKLSGTEFWLLKRRHFGVRCTVCYDKLTREVLRAKCPTCYGTSWVGGYFTGLIILGERQVSAAQTSMTPQSKDDVNLTQIHCMDFPRIDVDDILVEQQANRRWIVKQRDERTLKGVLVIQVVTVSEIGRRSVEYDVPLALV